MARRAGVITISLTAGTSQLIQDLEAGKAKVKDFGSSAGSSIKTFETHTVSSMQATSAAIREAFGGSNIRAVERFLTIIPGVGAALQNAFPLIGLAAFGGLVIDLGEKVRDFFKSIKYSSEIIAASFRTISQPLILTNDELRVSIDRVNNDIAKLQGRRENTLALTLDEARVAADKLADALSNDIIKLNSFLKEQNIGVFKSLIGNESSTTDIKKYFGGESGSGGFSSAQAKINADAQQRIADAAKRKDVDGVKNIERERDAALKTLNSKAISFLDEQIAKFTEREKRKESVDQFGRKGFVDGQDNTAPKEIANAVRSQLQSENSNIDLNAALLGGTRKKEALQASATNAKLDRPFENKIKDLNVQLEGLKAKLLFVGADDSTQAIVKGFEASLRAIEEVNKALGRNHTALTKTQEGQIALKEQQAAAIESEVAFKTKNDVAITSINNRIKVQQLLTAAIGKGYEETKKANVEAQLIAEFGKNYANGARAQDVKRARTARGDEFDQENLKQIKAATDALGNQIELEKTLADVESQGAAVVARVTLAYKLREIVNKGGAGATRELVRATIDRFEAEERVVDNRYLKNLNLEIDATVRLTRAQVQSGEAARNAALQTQRARLIDQGVKPNIADATIAAEELKYRLGIVDAEARIINAANDRLTILQSELAADKAIEESKGKSVENTRRQRDIEDEILKTQRDQALAVGGLQDGLRAFFLDMETQAEKPGKILYDGLQSALDKTTDSLAKIFTGQKGNFAKVFQGFGEELANASTKSLLKTGLGEIGKKLGIDPSVLNKKLGIKTQDGQTSLSAWWVQIAGPGGQSSASGSPAGALSIPGIGGLGKIGGDVGLFGGALGGGIFNLLSKGFKSSKSSLESVTSAIDFPGFADGGVPPVNSPYVVGERGPEVRVDGNPGTIIPNGQFGGGVTNYYSVDARGSDPVRTEAAIRRASVATHNAAVSSAARAINEQSRRRPR
jgi:hypothetical protein